MNALVRRIGVDPRAFRALLGASLRMDLRSQHYRRATRAGDNKLFTPLFWVIAQNLFISTVASAILVGRTDVFTFAAGSIAVSMLLLASAVVVEFHEVVLSPDDAAVLAPLPLSPQTYAAVRLTNLLFYVAVLGASLDLAPAVIGVWQRDAGVWFLPAYLVSCSAANVTATGAVIIVYLTLARFVGDRHVKDALAYAQIALTLLAVYGVQLLRRTENDRMLALLQDPPAWFAWTPPAWFASLVAATHFELPREHIWQAAAAVGSLVAVACVALWRLSRQYSLVDQGRRDTIQIRVQPTRTGLGAGWPGRFLTLVSRSREEAAALWFCWTMARRDHEFKMRSYPSLGAALGFFLLGLLAGQLTDPFGSTVAGTDVAPSIVVPFFLVMAVPIVANNTAFSRDYRAAWLFQCAPIRSPAALVSGLCNAILFFMVLPVLLALFAGFTFAWGNPLHAAVHCTAALLLCRITLHFTGLAVLRDVPFSRPYVRGAVSGRITLFVSVVMAGATVVGLIQMIAYRATSTLFAFLAALLLADRLLSWLRRRATVT